MSVANFCHREVWDGEDKNSSEIKSRFVSWDLGYWFGPAHMYFHLFLVIFQPSASSSVSSLSSVINLAWAIEISRYLVPKHFYTQFLFFCRIRYVNPFAGDVYLRIRVHSDCSRNPHYGVHVYTHRGNQIGRPSFIVAVEVLLSTVGPNFTCWVGAAQKVNGVHQYNFVQMHTAQLVMECQQLAKINTPSQWQLPIPSWTLTVLDFCRNRKWSCSQPSHNQDRASSCFPLKKEASFSPQTLPG